MPGRRRPARCKVAGDKQGSAVEVKERGWALSAFLKLEPGRFAGTCVRGASVRGDSRGFGTSSKELGGWGCHGLRREERSGGRWGSAVTQVEDARTVRETNLGLTGSDVCWAYLQPVEMRVYINRDRERQRWKQRQTEIKK